MAITQSFVNGLCVLSGVGHPEASQIDAAQNDYVFQRYRVNCLSVGTSRSISGEGTNFTRPPAAKNANIAAVLEDWANDQNYPSLSFLIIWLPHRHLSFEAYRLNLQLKKRSGWLSSQLCLDGVGPLLVRRDRVLHRPAALQQDSEPI